MGYKREKKKLEIKVHRWKRFLESPEGGAGGGGKKERREKEKEHRATINKFTVFAHGAAECVRALESAGERVEKWQSLLEPPSCSMVQNGLILEH